MTVKIIPLGLIVLAVISVAIAAVVPASKPKAHLRLLASLFVGAAFGLDSVLQLARENGSLARYFELIMAAFLIYAGLRKHSRDPEGKTPAASIL